MVCQVFLFFQWRIKGKESLHGVNKSHVQRQIYIFKSVVVSLCLRQNEALSPHSIPSLLLTNTQQLQQWKCTEDSFTVLQTHRCKHCAEILCFRGNYQKRPRGQPGFCCPLVATHGRQKSEHFWGKVTVSIKVKHDSKLKLISWLFFAPNEWRQINIKIKYFV